MNIFLTGTTGFIGKVVLEKLTSLNHSTTCLLRNTSSKKRLGSREIVGDLNKPESYSPQLKKSQPECAILLAWEGLPDYTPELCLKNLTSQLTLINQLITIGCKKIILVGSCWQYGKQEGQVNEKADPISPGLFAECKNVIFKLSKIIADEDQVTVIDARLFFVYGRGQRQTSLIPSAIASIKKEEKPRILNPESGNDFIHVSDVASGIVKLVESDTTTGTYNLGSGKSTQVKELINTIYKLNKSPLPFDSNYKPNGFWADISKMRSIGWEPSTKIEDALKDLL